MRAVGRLSSAAFSGAVCSKAGCPSGSLPGAAASFPVQAALGLGGGWVADWACAALDAHLGIRTPLLALAAKVAVLAAALSALANLAPTAAAGWHATLPGLLFVGLFFGLQRSAFRTARAVVRHHRHLRAGVRAAD